MNNINRATVASHFPTENRPSLLPDRDYKTDTKQRNKLKPLDHFFSIRFWRSWAPSNRPHLADRGDLLIMRRRRLCALCSVGSNRIFFEPLSPDWTVISFNCHFLLFFLFWPPLSSPFRIITLIFPPHYWRAGLLPVLS